MNRIAFAGTDGRTLLSALIVSTAKSENYPQDYQGVVVRGTPAMPRFAELMNWPVEFVATASNSVADYAEGIIQAMSEGAIDYVVPMPEALLFDGLVDMLEAAGFGERVIGLSREGAFIEGDKIKCKELCREAGIPVAQSWTTVDAKNYDDVLSVCLDMMETYGGAVLKYPYSAGGKGARIILNAWQIRDVYDTLINDYKAAYRQLHGKRGPWPLLIESLMSGAEISFTIFVDKNGHFCILPTAMDYPERFEGPASKDNPITGGVGAISPHPMETPELIRMAGDVIARPLIDAMRARNILRPCVLYPGCFVSLDKRKRPTQIRVSEVNIRPGEPEAQPVTRRLRNLGALIAAAATGALDSVAPEVRDDQIAMCVALVTGPGGPDGQRGYPWSCTKGEPLEIDFSYLKKKGIQVIPSAMTYADDEQRFKSDGTRVAFLNANVTVKGTDSAGTMAKRLALRRDIGSHYEKMAQLFPSR
jgi:phosphoribosylamine--glycine ligase